ncbi:MAG: hypothetical protein HRT61_20535 [Ekhidna sp.]|nr:hypothetical protein [Ekhidna sp.]
MRTQVKAFIIKHYHHLFTLIFGAVSATIITMTYLGRDRMELTFSIQSTKKIVDLEGTPAISNLSISYGEEEIKVLYVMDIKIQNTGNQVILLENFYDKQVAIWAPDEKTTFITFNTETSGLTGIGFSKYDHFIYLEPDYLNPNEYINLYIFFTQEGEPKTPDFRTSLIGGEVIIIDNR